VKQIVILAAVVAAGCGAPPKPVVEAPKPDPVKESWYAPAVAELAGLNRDAERLLRAGKKDDAASAVTKGQEIANKLLTAPYPTLEAMEAASDTDDLYGRMLLLNGNVGWARLQFQKNVVRWKAWKPATEETLRRRKHAEEEIAECDRRLGAGGG
jgi:hypothetical protein